MEKKDQSIFSPQIEAIEREIIEEVFNSPLFSFRSPYINKIIAYFVTRKYLTQNQIKKLTDFSAGEISQDLNQLIEQGIIQVFDKNENGEIIYAMPSLKTVLIKRATSLFKTVIDHEGEFKKIKSEMKKDHSLEKINGYENILQVINYYLGVIPTYKNFLSKFQSLIDQLSL